MYQTSQTFSGEILIFIFLPLIILLLIYKRLFLSESPPLPPGPFAWPIVGNMFQIGRNPHETLAWFAETYGPIFSFKLGPKLVVVGSSPTAAMEILKTHDRVLSDRFVPQVVPARTLGLKNCSIGWIKDCGDEWRSLKTFCKAELFSGNSIASQASKRDRKVIEMLGFLGKMEGRVLKIREVSFATVLNMLSNVLVSKDLVQLEFESSNGAICNLMKSITDVVSTPNISDFYPILGPFDLQNLQKRANDLSSKALKIWEEIIEEKRKINKSDKNIDNSSHDFLDALIRNGYSTAQINVLFWELFSAGTETTSSTIEWAMAELVRNPRCMKIVQDELLREIGKDQIVQESDLSKLTYLEACVKEILRLHPAGPLLLPHCAAESCTVMNYTIPKDAQVIVNFSAIGRDPSNWEEPLEFRPERFLEKSGLDFKGNSFEYFPFGSGRRICPGMPMAVKQIQLIVANLVHSFNWSLPNGMTPKDIDVREKYGLAMRMEEPLLLVPKAKTYT